MVVSDRTNIPSLKNSPARDWKKRSRHQTISCFGRVKFNLHDRVVDKREKLYLQIYLINFDLASAFDEGQYFQSNRGHLRLSNRRKSSGVEWL